jgi:endonuclease III
MQNQDTYYQKRKLLDDWIQKNGRKPTIEEYYDFMYEEERRFAETVASVLKQLQEEEEEKKRQSEKLSAACETLAEALKAHMKKLEE